MKVNDESKEYRERVLGDRATLRRNWRSNWLSCIFDEALLAASFHQLADDYSKISQGDYKDPREILSDGEWHAVVRTAAHLWNTLKQRASDPEDQAVIESLESRFGKIKEDDPTGETTA